MSPRLSAPSCVELQAKHERTLEPQAKSPLLCGVLSIPEGGIKAPSCVKSQAKLTRGVLKYTREGGSRALACVNSIYGGTPTQAYQRGESMSPLQCGAPKGEIKGPLA